MGRRPNPIEFKHSVEELKTYYQKATTAVQRRRAQAIWLLADGVPREEVLKITAYALPSLLKAIRLYRTQGLEGLIDQRKDNPGAPTLLSDDQILLLAQIVRDDYEQGKLWRGADVQTWMEETLGEEVHFQRAYEVLAHIGFTLQLPRPSHTKSSAAAQADLKKTSSRLSKKLKSLLEAAQTKKV